MTPGEHAIYAAAFGAAVVSGYDSPEVVAFNALTDARRLRDTEDPVERATPQHRMLVEAMR